MGSETLFEIGFGSKVRAMLITLAAQWVAVLSRLWKPSCAVFTVCIKLKTQPRSFFVRFRQSVSQPPWAENARSPTSMRASEQWDIRQFML